MKLSVIIPAHNEATRISTTLESVSSYLSRVSYDYEILVVTNNCSDDTIGVIEKFKLSIPQLRYIDVNKKGAPGGTKGLAVREGMLEARGEYRIFMDADNATNISEIEKFWLYFEKGFDVVIGSRYISGSDVAVPQVWYRRVLGRLANLLIRTLLLPGIYDTQCGFKMFTSQSAQKIFSLCNIDGWGADIEMLALAKRYHYKIIEVPIVWREVGESSLKLKAFWWTFKDLVRIMLG